MTRDEAKKTILEFVGKDADDDRKLFAQAVATLVFDFLDDVNNIAYYASEANDRARR